MTKINLGISITHLQFGEVLMDFFGGEQISRDIGYFLAVRFSLVRNIAECFISKKIDIETFRNDIELLSNSVELSNFMCVYPSTPLSISKLMSTLSKSNDDIYRGVLENWTGTASSKVIVNIGGVERLREMLVTNDENMLRYLSKLSITKRNALLFVCDFHFKHMYVNYALSKKIKLYIYEVMRNSK
ncbi:hypothetical protein [Aeromonas veronii]|uniref:hypothetical protein n=1 Tax=Aeromonas veronii TaxID=654 RepID=UPI000AA8EB14|nr:hypothetical protein [Aeromonas veronii]